MGLVFLSGNQPVFGNERELDSPKGHHKTCLFFLGGHSNAHYLPIEPVVIPVELQAKGQVLFSASNLACKPRFSSRRSSRQTKPTALAGCGPKGNKEVLTILIEVTSSTTSWIRSKQKRPPLVYPKTPSWQSTKVRSQPESCGPARSPPAPEREILSAECSAPMPASLQFSFQLSMPQLGMQVRPGMGSPLPVQGCTRDTELDAGIKPSPLPPLRQVNQQPRISRHSGSWSA